MNEHHPSCQPSDRDLVWLCAQCGGHESAESILDELAAEREKVENLHKILGQKRDMIKAERQANRGLFIESNERYQQLQECQRKLNERNGLETRMTCPNCEKLERELLSAQADMNAKLDVLREEIEKVRKPAVEELAQEWERRLVARQPISLEHGEDKGANYQLKQCLEELRACAESSSTVGDKL